MRWLSTLLLPLCLTVTACTSGSYDLMDTASVSPRFHDTDPQHFDGKTPHRHEVHGIDVSKWNGTVDWPRVKASGIDFVFIKATEGADRVDPTFEANWRGAARAGIPQAAYHFYYFCGEPDAQADWFIQNVPKSASYLPPVLDVEWNGASKTCKYRPSKATAVYELKKFMDRLERHYGKRPIIYTSVDFHRDNLAGYFRNYHFWVRSVAAHPQQIYGDRAWAFWQYTSTGIVPGIEGEADINVFSGTREHWQRWLAYADKT